MSEKIDHLTPEQEQKLIEFRDEYQEIGFSTEPADRATAERAISAMYVKMSYEEPQFIWMEGQMSAQIAIALIQAGFLKDLNDYLETGKKDKASNAIKLDEGIYQSLLKGIREVFPEADADDFQRGFDKVLDGILSNKDFNPQFQYTYFWGQMDAYWIARYLFPHLHLRPMHTDEQMEILNLWDQIARSCSWWWPYEHICVCSERPLEIHVEDHRLHKDGGPAFVSRDGWQVWYLNGIQVSQEIAETPGDQLDAHLLIKETNIEVRREVMKKIGAKKALEDLGAKVIDSATKTTIYPKIQEHHYELVLLDLGDNRQRPYLKMINPTTGDYHVEGVPPECTTVDQALEFRNKTTEFPVALT